MTAVLREFSPSGETVGDLNPSQPDPNDAVYVFKAELPIDGSSPIEAAFMNPVPQAKVASLRLGAHSTVAIYRWRYQREGPPGFRVGRHLRYDPRAVHEWVKSLGEGAA
jgi:hypothetical protein